MTCYQISEKGLELVKRISQKEKEATHEFVYAKGTRELLSVRSRRPAVLRCLHAIDATRFHQTRSWVVSFLLKRPFGPFPVNTMLTQSFHTGGGRRGHRLQPARARVPP